MRLFGNKDDSLPKELEINGFYYPIKTDFRDWISFELMMFDEDLTDDEKFLTMLFWYMDDAGDVDFPIDPNDMREAVNRLIWFHQCGRQLEEQGKANLPNNRIKNLVYDFEKDEDMIASSFFHAYGIRLPEVEYMHWWEFRAYFWNIPSDTPFGRAMHYRSADDKELSKHEKKLKKMLDLNRRPGRIMTKEERDAELIRHAREAKERAEKSSN